MIIGFGSVLSSLLGLSAGIFVIACGFGFWDRRRRIIGGLIIGIGSFFLVQATFGVGLGFDIYSLLSRFL